VDFPDILLFILLNHRSAGYEPAGITWLPHPADTNHCTGAYISDYSVHFFTEMMKNGCRLWLPLARRRGNHLTG